MSESLLDDVAHASAAYFVNCCLPRLEEMTASQRFELVKAAFEANLAAYRDAVRGWGLEPSRN